MRAKSSPRQTRGPEGQEERQDMSTSDGLHTYKHGLHTYKHTQATLLAATNEEALWRFKPLALHRCFLPR